MPSFSVSGSSNFDRMNSLSVFFHIVWEEMEFSSHTKRVSFPPLSIKSVRVSSCDIIESWSFVSQF